MKAGFKITFLAFGALFILSTSVIVRAENGGYYSWSESEDLGPFICELDGAKITFATKPTISIWDLDGISCQPTKTNKEIITSSCACKLFDDQYTTQTGCSDLSTFLIKKQKISEQCVWKIPEGLTPELTKKIQWKPLAPNLAINIPTVKPFTTKGMEKPDAEGNVYIPFIGEYAAGAYKYILLIAGIIAAVRILTMGFNYIWAGGNSQKIEEAKSGIGHALIGLVLVLGSYLLLYTINPDLVKFKSLKIKVIETIEATGGDAAVSDNLHGGKLDIAIPQKLGINCPGNGGDLGTSAKSFMGKVTYVLGGKGNIGADNMMQMDCSRYVSYVYNCAGYPLLTWTAQLFSNKNVESVNAYKSGNPPSVNGANLQTGDLIGWKKGDNEKKVGHVMMYLGDGKFIHNSSMQNGKEPGKGVKVFSSDAKLTGLFTHIMRKDKIINEIGAGTFAKPPTYCCYFSDKPPVDGYADEATCSTLENSTGSSLSPCKINP